MKTESFGWLSSDNAPKSGSWNVQDVPITILKDKMSRVYAVPPAERQKDFYNTLPSKYETADQGLELAFRVIRMGFEDIYLSRPGSFSGKFGKDYFICIGPASLVVPVLVKPCEDWKGALVDVEKAQRRVRDHILVFIRHLCVLMH